MKVLVDVTPTSEQLPIISNPQDGVTLIRGAAGSGKTTTALLMLKQLSEYWIRRRVRNHDTNPVKILVLTYNRTLKGYVAHLAEKQIGKQSGIDLTVTTFGKWSIDLTGTTNLMNDNLKESLIVKHGNTLFPGNRVFLLDEVDYCLGRFLHEKRDDYLTTRREGRGIAPRMERPMRERLLTEVIKPYNKYKQKHNTKDWNDLALELVASPRDEKYDIVVADETQDFSANQIRAVMKHIANPSTIVLVLDAAQRIYPRGWNWREVGIKLNPNRSFHLKKNHRNTVEICRLAKPILEGMELGDDGSMPDLDSCDRHGQIPMLLKGKFSLQVSYAISQIKKNIDLTKESVAFAHPKAGGWFDYLREKLSEHGLKYVILTKRSDWPKGNENIALISMHSAKGLEFDHIFILGLDEETTPHGSEEGDSTWENLRRLLAMTITRARETVTLGCKPKEASSLTSCLESDTYEMVRL
jgi:superfamily I DNA/RNA helicase